MRQKAVAYHEDMCYTKSPTFLYVWYCKLLSLALRLRTFDSLGQVKQEFANVAYVRFENRIDREGSCYYLLLCCSGWPVVHTETLSR